MAGCITRKKMFATQDIAEEVLLEAWTKYRYSAGHGPLAVYRCDDCGQFHLTSSGEMNPKLAQHLQEGKIQLRQEADKWLSKIKKR
jgi:hypothetical protein